jgi:integrase
MAGLKFFIKSKSNPKAIYVRLTDGRKTDLTASTGYLIESENWSESKQFVHPKKVFDGKQNLTNNLIGIESKVLGTYNDDKGTGKVINLEWLKRVISLYKNPDLDKVNDSLGNAITEYRKHLETKVNPRTEKRISKLTLKNFDTSLYRLRKYEEYKGKTYNLNEIDLSFHDDFTKFCTNEMGLGINSIGSSLKQVKTVCLNALDRGMAISPQISSKKFNATTEKTKFVTLNDFDLQRIKKFKGSDYLNNAKDWLIIGCWTGCRVGDLMQLTENNIEISTTGIRSINYTQSKTNKQVKVPIHEDVQEIVKRLQGFPRPISNAKFNEYIKKVCQKVGINERIEGTRQNPNTHLKENGTFEKWELVRTHTCRRSFATNHYSQMPNKMIMAITGHATEAMLLTYVGEVDTNHLEDFTELWAKIKEEKADKVKDLKGIILSKRHEI